MAGALRQLLTREDTKHAKGEVVQWRQVHAKAELEAEKQTWLADHPGEEWQEHECAMTEAEPSGAHGQGLPGIAATKSKRYYALVPSDICDVHLARPLEV